MRAIFGLFDDPKSAKQAAEAIEKAGFSEKHISRGGPDRSPVRVAKRHEAEGSPWHVLLARLSPGLLRLRRPDRRAVRAAPRF
jgi:hypothetical protein